MANMKKNLLSAGAAIAARNKRYIVWFYLLNLVFASLGAAAFGMHAHGVLDNSLHADRLLHSFDLVTLVEMIARPEFGPVAASTAPAAIFMGLFFLATLLFLPGVLLGYASDHRLPRDEFYRACGRNVWRFVRLFFLFVIIAGPVAGILSGVQAGLVKAADHTSNERLPFFLQVGGTAILFLVLTAIRMWFDLAETDVVVGDEGSVRRSVARAFRHSRRNLWSFLGSYVLIALLAIAIVVGGVWLWDAIIPPSSLFGAFLISQLILLLHLATRFWQRASAVALHGRLTDEAALEPQVVPVIPVPAVSIAPGQSGA